MNNNSKNIKQNAFFRQTIVTVILASLFLVLLIAFLVISPFMKDDENGSDVVASLIWEKEVAGTGGSILMFEHLTRDNISTISVHNPALGTSHGAQYVDWMLYKATENVSVGKNIIEKGNFYIKGYEYAPLYESDTDSAVASIINDAAYTLTLSRLVDHAEDFSKYGLDFENDAEATYCEIVKDDGTVYKFYIGDRIPSGTAYYVRMAGTDLCLDENSELYNTEIENDSVYIYDCSNVLISPTEAVSPILLYPMAGTNHAYFDFFTIKEYTEKEEEPTPKIEMRATNTRSYLTNPLTNPVSAFAANAKYYSVIPKGYHSSSAFDELFADFVDGLNGISVKELATYVVYTDEETGEEKVKYDFSDVINKYFEDGPAYTMAFSWKGIENIVDVSHKTENNTYYVVSYVYNTICEVSADTLAFLEWEQKAFIGKEMLRLVITDCKEISISGKYADDNSESGWKTVETLFELEIEDDDISDVISKRPDGTLDGKGNMTDKEWIENFRSLYRSLLFVYVKGTVSEEKVNEIMQGDAFATITITTSDHTTTYVEPDDKDAETEEIKVDGMKRIYRFYQYSSGRCLMTIQDKISGTKGDETGTFYLTMASIEKILKSAEKMAGAEQIDLYERE